MAIITAPEYGEGDRLLVISDPRHSFIVDGFNGWPFNNYFGRFDNDLVDTYWDKSFIEDKSKLRRLTPIY